MSVPSLKPIGREALPAGVSAWEDYTETQRAYVIEREMQRIQRQRTAEEYERYLRKECAVQRGDVSPYEEDVQQVRSLGRKMLDKLGDVFSLRF